MTLMLKNCEAKTLMNLNPEASGLNGKKTAKHKNLTINVEINSKIETEN